MTVNSIFLDADSLNATSNNYGIVSATCGTFSQKFTEQYLNKFMLVEELQNKLNAVGADLCNLPDDADRTACTAAWQMLKSILDEVRAL